MTNDTKNPLATVGGGSNWQDVIPAKPAPDTIQNFIDEQRWRDISEAPETKGATFLVKTEQRQVVIGGYDRLGYPYTSGKINYSDRSNDNTHFLPIPTDTPAVVMQIAIDALREVATETVDSCDLIAIRTTASYKAEAALAQIEAKIGEAK
jgi:hypothetical protein